LPTRYFILGSSVIPQNQLKGADSRVLQPGFLFIIFFYSSEWILGLPTVPGFV